MRDEIRECQFPFQAPDLGRIISNAVILAVAVNEDGKREVLGVATGPSEAETFWTEFLRSRHWPIMGCGASGWS